jgi:putative DNA primase/helicase
VNPFELVLSRLKGVRSASDGKAEARCPVHKDEHASLSIAQGSDGRALLWCHAGCDTVSVAAELGLTMRDLMPEGSAPPRKAKLGSIVATYDYCDEVGELLFQVCRYEPKNFRQRHRTKLGEKADREGWCWSTKGLPRVPYHLPQLRPAITRGETIWVVEGEKDVEALELLGLVATCNAGGAGKWREEDTAFLAGASLVVIVADRDSRESNFAGQEHATSVATSLTGSGTRCKIVEVSVGKDASDWIAAGATREDFEQLGAQASIWTSAATEPPLESESPASGRPDIQIGPEEAAIVDKAESLIASSPDLYQRAGLLVHVRRDLAPPRFLRRPPGAPQIAPLSVPTCREELSRVARWWGYDARSSKWVQKRPPDWAAEDLRARGEWPNVRPLVGVIEAPILRLDGTVLLAEGYDAETGLLYVPSGRVAAIADRPNREDAFAARDALLEVVADFPFALDAHRSAWLASLLTFFARYAISGRVPLTFLEAPAAGTGKTLLADTIGLICTGRVIAKMANTLDDAEMRKRLFAIALSGDPFVLFDNVRGGFGTPSLDMALTAGLIRERVLGLSEDKVVPLDAIFFASGNNVELLGDTRRRVIPCRIDARVERPEERDGFLHPQLESWIVAERPRLIAAALTVLRAFHLAGCPVVGKARPWGGFLEWQALICGSVRWLEMPAPEETRAGLIEAASDTERLGALLRAWQCAQPSGGMTASEALRRAGEAEGAALGDAIAASCQPRGGGQATSESVGYYLRRVRDKVVDGRCFGNGKLVGDRHWFVEKTSADGVDGADPRTTREKVAGGGADSLGKSGQPSPPSAPSGKHACRCGQRFSCPPTPDGGCLCPSCGLPPVGGHRDSADGREVRQ